MLECAAALTYRSDGDVVLPLNTLGRPLYKRKAWCRNRGSTGEQHFFLAVTGTYCGDKHPRSAYTPLSVDAIPRPTQIPSPLAGQPNPKPTIPHPDLPTYHTISTNVTQQSIDAAHKRSRMPFSCVRRNPPVHLSCHLKRRTLSQSTLHTVHAHGYFIVTRKHRPFAAYHLLFTPFPPLPKQPLHLPGKATRHTLPHSPVFHAPHQRHKRSTDAMIQTQYVHSPVNTQKLHFMHYSQTSSRHTEAHKSSFHSTPHLPYLTCRLLSTVYLAIPKQLRRFPENTTRYLFCLTRPFHVLQHRFG